VVFAEKVLPVGEWTARLAGFVLFGAAGARRGAPAHDAAPAHGAGSCIVHLQQN